MKPKLGSRLPGEINNLRYADDTTIMAQCEEERKNLLIRVKEDEKAGMKLNIKKQQQQPRPWHPVPSLHGK